VRLFRFPDCFLAMVRGPPGPQTDNGPNSSTQGTNSALSRADSLKSSCFHVLPLLQLREFCLGLQEDWKVGIGIFPEGEKITINRFCLFVAR
jgi:hypothetical protein